MTAGVGPSLGGYQIEGVIGRGPRTEVYRARHAESRRTVALKVLHGELAAAPSARQRFLAAAQASATLDHPHLVTITDIGEEEGGTFVAQELLGGGSLRAVLDATSADASFRPITFSVEVVRQAALGLAFAHQSGQIHGDLHPGNLLLRSGLSHVKVGDFGLAGLESGAVMTAADLLLSVPAYLAPEQCLDLALDGRTDLYALGVIFYELVTGRVPFPARAFTEALQQHVNVAPPAPRLLRPDLPEVVEAIILRCLAKEPQARFAAAAELAVALGEVGAELATIPAMGRVGALSAVPSTGSVDDPAASDETEPEGAPEGPVLSPETPDALAMTQQIDPERVAITLDEGVERLVLTPGQPVAVRVVLRNSGRVATRVEIRVEGVAAGWVRGGDRTVEIAPDGRASLVLPITVEAIALNVAGEYPTKIVAWSQAAGRAVGGTQVIWTVLPFTAGTLTMTPAEGRGGRRARYQLTLRNWGNAPVRRTLRAGDGANALAYQLEREWVDLDPSGAATVDLLVEGPRHLVGRTERYEFQVVATAAGQPPLTADGRFVQPSRIPTWSLALVLVALFGLITAVVLLFGRGPANQVAGVDPTVAATTVAAVPTIVPVVVPSAVTSSAEPNSAEPSPVPSSAAVAPTPAVAQTPAVSAVSGTPTAAAVAGGKLELSATSLTFGTQRVGAFGLTRTLRLENSGNAPLPLSERRLTGASEDYWLLDDRCPAQLGAGERCMLTIQFKPTLTGVRTATLLILFASGEANAVTVMGTGVVTLPGTPVPAPPSQAPPPLAAARADHAAALLDNGRTVLVAGGRSGPNQLKTVELYDVAANVWRGGQDMTMPRADHTATTLPDGRVLVLGGHNGTGTLKSAEVYDPVTQTWSTFAEMRGEREGHTATLYADPRTRHASVLVLGGSGKSGALATGDVYDLATQSWAAAPALPEERTGQTATLLADQRHVLVVGGTTSNGVAAAPLSYDLVSGLWSPVASLPAGRKSFAAALLPNGKVLLSAGVLDGADLTSTLLYDPNAAGGQVWSDGVPLARGRSSHTATLLPYGRLLLVGGRVAGKETSATELYALTVVAGGSVVVVPATEVTARGLRPAKPACAG